MTRSPEDAIDPQFTSYWQRAWFDIDAAMVHYLRALHEGDDPDRIAIVGPKVGEALDRLPAAREADRGN